MTDRAKHRFTVKEFVTEDEKSEPWLMFELAEGSELPTLGTGFLGFDLKSGTTVEQAQGLADAINNLVSATTYTDPHKKKSIYETRGLLGYEDFKRLKDE